MYAGDERCHPGAPLGIPVTSHRPTMAADTGLGPDFVFFVFLPVGDLEVHMDVSPEQPGPGSGKMPGKPPLQEDYV